MNRLPDRSEAGWLGQGPFLWLDATCVKLREGHVRGAPEPIARWPTSVSMAVIMAVAVDTDGQRKILEITVTPSEPETLWPEFLRSIARRGLRGVQLVVSDTSYEEQLDQVATPEGLEPSTC